MFAHVVPGDVRQPRGEVLVGGRQRHVPDGIARRQRPGDRAPAPRPADLGNVPAGIIPEASHRQFDDPVVFMVEPGGLYVQNSCDALRIVRIPKTCFTYAKIDAAELARLAEAGVI